MCARAGAGVELTFSEWVSPARLARRPDHRFAVSMGPFGGATTWRVVDDESSGRRGQLVGQGRLAATVLTAESDVPQRVVDTHATTAPVAARADARRRGAGLHVAGTAGARLRDFRLGV
jgi:hypothetical protein